MSGSKRKRKEQTKQLREREKEEFGEWASDALEDAQEFLNSATPFEISRALSEIGVSTTHRKGIEDILEEAVNDPDQSKLPPAEIIRGFLTHLLNRWKSEIQAKNREYDLDDFALLAETARYYAIPWVATKLAKKEPNPAPGLAQIQTLLEDSAKKDAG